VQLRTLRLEGAGGGEALPLDLDSEQTLVLVFGAAALADRPGLLLDLTRGFPRSTVLGCSTAGEIFGTKVLDDSMVVAVARFEATQLRGAAAPVHAAEQSFAAGEALGRQLAGAGLRGVHVLSDGLAVNGSALVRGLAAVLPAGVVVTGGLVRLTASGLGCNDWPNCNNTKIVDVSTKHAAIEQINRLFTFLVSIGVALAALAAWFRRPRRRDLLVFSLVMLVGVPAQGVVGAVVVWSKLNPALVQVHFVLSMVLVWAAVMMLVRSREPDNGHRVSAVVPRIRRRVRLLAAWTTIAVLAGTVVTGTGPHAGKTLKDAAGNCIITDEAAKRFFGKECDINGGALVWVTRVHGTIVWITVAIAFTLLWHLRRLRHDRQVLDAPLTAWLLTAVVQGAVGYLQYANGLPVALVALHLGGATVLVGCTAWLWASTTAAPSSAALN